MQMRGLFHKYESNVEVVDPQLKNNPELVEALVTFENAWEKGKTFILQKKQLSQALHFSEAIEAATEKHPKFADAVESRSAEIFFSIPSLLILRCLE
jgi:hypothetical protein